MERAERRRRLVAILVLLLLGAAVAVVLLVTLHAGSEHPGQTQNEAQASKSPRPYSYLKAKAEELGLDPQRIRAFVHDNITKEDYEGLLRGPLGTLWAGAGNDADRKALEHALLAFAGVKPREEPAARAHRLRVRIITTPRQGDPVVGETTFRTAELTGHLLVLSYDAADNTTRLRLDGRAVVKMNDDAGDALDQVVEFTHRDPSGGETTYRRGIFSRRYDDYEPMFDPRNVHVITVTTGWVPKWVFDKEMEIVQSGRRKVESPDAGTNWLLALSHLWQSGANVDGPAKHFGVKALWTEPRVVIASTCYVGTGKSEPARMLDLRRNRITIRGGDEAARLGFAVTRSLGEGALEGEVIHDALGAQALTAMAVLRHARELAPQSVPERLDFYATSLKNLQEQMRPGSTVTFSAPGKARLSVVFRKVKGDALHVAEISDALRGKMDASGIKFEVLKKGAAAPSQFGRAALELETLFGPVLQSPTDYRPRLSVEESGEELLFANSRIFFWGLGRVNLEYQVRSVDGDVKYDSIDYYDEVNKKPYRYEASYTIPAKQTEQSDIISCWYSQDRYDKGAMFLYFSRKMYRELKEKGETVVRYMKRDKSLSEPIKLFLMERKPRIIIVNSRPRMVPVLVLAGDFVSKDPKKKEKAGDYPRRYEDTEHKRWLMNRWTILDNPDSPLVMMGGMRFQTQIPGKVVSAGTQQGIPGARVTVKGTGVSGVTWGDGTLLLPVVPQKFGVFTVTAQRAGYQPWSREVDFREGSAFPLKIEMTPLKQDPAFTWIEGDAAESEIASLKTTERVKDLIRREMRQRPGSGVLTTTHRVPFGGASAHAWLLFDPSGPEVIAMTEDGLYASSALGGFAKDYVTNAAKAALGGGSPFATQQGAINYYAGHIAAWYVYSAGRLDAISRMMEGEEFPDLGHRHAMKYAADWLRGMDPAVSSLVGRTAGVRAAQFKAGFAAALAYFDSQPEFRGQ